MKRLFVIACVGSTFILACLVVLRLITRKEPSPGQPTQKQIQLATQVAGSYEKVKTHPLSLDEFMQTVQTRAATNLDNLSEDERKKLLGCIGQFYLCYSTGDFTAFKQFRLHPPFTVSEPVASAVKKIASRKGLSLQSDEEIIHLAWNNYNGANKIGEVDTDSIILAVVKRHDLGLASFQPSAGKFPGLATTCWTGAVSYQPTPDEILKKEGFIRFFTLELFVRFSPHADGPATPLVLVGYWDSVRGDWMPYALCTVLHVGSYDTIF